METIKKKLLIATDNFLPRWDGISRFLSEIIPRLKMNYDITVIAPDFGPYEDASITLIKIPTYKKLRLGDFHPPKFKYFKIKKAVRQADIVFTQTIGPIGGTAIYLARKQHKPIVSFIHSLESDLVPKAMEHNWPKKYAHSFTKSIMHWLYSKSTLLVVPSQTTAEALIWQHIDTPTKEVHLGVDPVKFCPSPNKEESKKALHLEAGDFIIGFHGRLGYEKDLMTLFRAFIRLQNKHPAAKLLLVGDGVEALKNVLKARRGVILAGPQAEPEKYLQAMDIYVLPSLTETTSLSTLEAMSCGLPVIATPVGFVKDYIRPGYNGLLFPVQQTYYLTVQLEKLIGSESMRRMLGSRARETVMKDFNWNITAKEIEEALEDAYQRWIRRLKVHKPDILDEHFRQQARKHADKLKAQELINENVQETVKDDTPEKPVV